MLMPTDRQFGNHQAYAWAGCFVLGVCVPMDSKVTVSKHREVKKIDQVGNNTSGSVFFHNNSTGVLYIRFTGTYERASEDIDPCGKDRTACLAKVRSKNSK